MASPLLISALLSSLLVAQSPAPGTQLVFKGTVAKLNRDRTSGPAEKTFDLTLLTPGSSAGGTSLYWLVDENGRGRWHWPERFGQMNLGRDGKVTGQPAALLYDRGEESSMVAIGTPLLPMPEKPLTEGLTWKAGDLEYEVLKAAKLGDQSVWEVQSYGRFGRQALLSVEKDTPIILQAKQRVFMGQGEEYELQLKLVGREKLQGEKLKAVGDGFDALLQLRSRLNRPARSEEVNFNAKQIALLQEELPSLVEKVTEGPLVKVVQAASKDLEVQSQLAGSVDKLIEKMQGQDAPKFTAEGVSSAKLSSDDLKGVTVLHFWDYRDSPLKEPYGQVGYLDFLYHKKQEGGLKLYGVAVDSRLRDEDTRGATIRGVRKLRDFMNLSYPILLDEGALLRQFGDPRLLGAELPLFVVIVDGKIHHYHVGFYEVDRNEGLKELNAVVSEALEKGK